MLGYELHLWLDTGFHNCYIDVKSETMYLVFKKNIEYLSNFLKLKEHLDFNIHYIYFEESDGYYIFQLKIPDEFRNDFYLFLEGSYSKMSENYKQQVLKLYLHVNKNLYNALNRTFYPKKSDIEALEERLGEKLYNSEITSSPYLKVETFNRNEFITNEN